MSSNSDLLTSLNEMYEAANRRAEATEWRDNYATGYSDGLWDARTRVRESPNWQKAYEEIFEFRLTDLYMAIKEARDMADRYQDAFYEWRLRGLELAYRIMSGGEEA